MTCTCECGNEPLGSIKRGEFLDLLQIGQLVKKDTAPCIEKGSTCFKLLSSRWMSVILQCSVLFLMLLERA